MYEIVFFLIGLNKLGERQKDFVTKRITFTASSIFTTFGLEVWILRSKSRFKPNNMGRMKDNDRPGIPRWIRKTSDVMDLVITKTVNKQRNSARNLCIAIDVAGPFSEYSL